MIRTRGLKWVAILAIGILPLSAGAGESPLAQLPADVPIVISLHGIHRTKERLAALIEKADPDVAKMALAHMDEALDKALDGRKLVGLDPAGPVFMALSSLPTLGGPPQPALIAKVTDYKAFRDAILKEDERKNLKKHEAGYEVTSVEGKDLYLIHRRGYVIMATEKEVAEQFLGHKGSGLEGKLDKHVAARLLESDAALYVDMTAVNKAYGEMLQGVRQMVGPLIDQAAENAPGQLDKETAKSTKEYIDGLFQAIQDSKHLLVAVALPPEGVALHVQAGFAKDSSTNKILAKIKPAPLSKLETLPPGYCVYMAMEWGPEAFRTIEPLLLGVLGAPAGAHAKALHQALDQLIAAGPGPTLAASTPPGKTLQVLRFEHPEKAVAAQLKFYEALAGVKTFGNMPLKEKPIVRADAETFRGTKFHYFSVKFDLDKQFENLPGNAQQMAAAMKKLTGEGANVWFGALEGNVVSVQTKDWKGAEKLLAQYVDKKGTVGAKSKTFEQTRERLPAKATVVALVSVPGAIDLGMRYAAAIMQTFGMEAPELAKTKMPDPYLGVSVTLHSGYAGLDLWIPGETARAVRRVVEAFKGAAQ